MHMALVTKPLYLDLLIDVRRKAPKRLLFGACICHLMLNMPYHTWKPPQELMIVLMLVLHVKIESREVALTLQASLNIWTLFCERYPLELRIL